MLGNSVNVTLITNRETHTKSYSFAKELLTEKSGEREDERMEF